MCNVLLATCHKSSPELTLAWKMNKTYNGTGTSGPCCFFPLVVFVRQQQRCTSELGWKSTERVNFMRSLFSVGKVCVAIVRFPCEWRQCENERGRGSEFRIRFIRKKQSCNIFARRERLLSVIFSLCVTNRSARSGVELMRLTQTDVYIWIYGWLKRRLPAIINSISNKLTSWAGVGSTQWDVGLWHNSVGIVVLELQVFSFSVFQLRVFYAVCRVRSV